MRHPKPEAGQITRISNKIVCSGDYIPFVMGGVVLFLATGLPGIVLLAEGNSPFFAFLFTPIVLMLLTLAICIAGTVRTKNTRTAGDKTVLKADKIWVELRKDYTAQFALPMMRKIQAHANQDGAHDYWGECRNGSCDERIATMHKLLPATKKSDDKSDIKEALFFLENRKSLNA